MKLLKILRQEKSCKKGNIRAFIQKFINNIKTQNSNFILP